MLNKALAVDPRESCWELDQPTFEVHLWIGEVADVKVLHSYLVEASGETALQEALAWAEAEMDSKRLSDSDRIVVHLRHQDTLGRLGLIRLCGRPMSWDQPANDVVMQIPVDDGE